MLEVKGLWAGYSSPVLQGVSFSVAQGELAAILGRNGSGKSTLLRALTGSAKVSQGQVLIQGRDCLPLSARQRARHMALLPQVIAPSSGLRAEEIIEMGRYPWESPLRPGGARSRQLVHQAAREFGVEHLLDQDCSVLSQGQRQLVQLARVVVQDAPVLLLDEPLSNLDARLRLQTREEIRKIQRATGITTVFVTHDQEEAMSISDRIVVMKEGVLQQIGQPQQVYDDPENLFVAKFLGTPPINVFDGRVQGGMLYLGDAAVLPVPGVADQEVTVGIRPEGFLPREDGALSCALSGVEVMGRDVSVVASHPACQAPVLRAILSAGTQVDQGGETVRFDLKPEKVFLFRPHTGERIRRAL